MWNGVSGSVVINLKRGSVIEPVVTRWARPKLIIGIVGIGLDFVDVYLQGLADERTLCKALRPVTTKNSGDVLILAG